jgi:general secretion pathway protein G
MNFPSKRVAQGRERSVRRQFGSRATGFTLLEILVVLTIIGLLAGLGIVHVGNIHRRAEVAAARLAVENSLKTVLNTYKFSTKNFPTTAEGLRVLLARPDNSPRWDGPYVENALNLVDPWGEPYQYEYPGRHNKEGYDLWSKGPDRQSGTADDVVNWEEAASTVAKP